MEPSLVIATELYMTMCIDSIYIVVAVLKKEMRECSVNFGE